MRAHRSASLLLALVGLLVVSGPVAATNLSGAILYSSLDTGADSGGQIWNTLGGDGIFNLYLATGTPPPFLNPGNDSGTSINQSLPSGTTTFQIFGAPGDQANPTGIVSLGLFFNGNTSTPGLVGVNATDNPGTGLIAASNATTVDLSFNDVSNPQSLTFADGVLTVKLTSFVWNAPSLGNDHVSPFDSIPGSGPGGVDDFIGSFTVEVSSAVAPVPEPATLLLLGATLAGAGLARWRRRSKSQAS